VIALDASDRNLAVVSEKVREAGVPRERFQCHRCDLVEGVPVGPAAADAVLDVWVLGSAIIPHDGRPGARRYLAELHRLMKPGGLLVMQFETLRPRRSPLQLRKYLSNLLGPRFEVQSTKAVRADYLDCFPQYRRPKQAPAILAVALRGD